eukprot:scaffold368_cov258-Pinguiococcus_pyrenoidosus.AAC.57
MGGGKHAALNKKSTSADNPNRDGSRKKSKRSGGTMRDKTTIERLKMYRSGKAIRNKKGEVIGGTLQMADRAGDVQITAQTGRVQPDRRWFGNTRTVAPEELDAFREQMTTKAADPYSVILRRKKVPMGLLAEAREKRDGGHLLQAESYESTFGARRTRKRPKLGEQQSSLTALMASAEKATEAYEQKGGAGADTNVERELDHYEAVSHDVFAKGQSKRIWSELYKVLDCSDVVLQVLDARNIPGTRSSHIERYLRKHAAHKHLVFIVNKCDLVPAWVARKWVRALSSDYPTIAFHASISNSFGKGALINLLRQFSKLHGDKKEISVGIIGYPNVGKSSIINTLMKKKVCKVAPIPGETKVWQYITLMRRIFLIDSPGVVHDEGEDEVETVLKGVVRAERLPDPTSFVAPILERVKKEYISRAYGLPPNWEDDVDFLKKLAVRQGRLRAGGEPDLHNVAVNVINDWQRGKLPFFAPPPGYEAGEERPREGDGERTEHMNDLNQASVEMVMARVERRSEETPTATGEAE